MGANFAQTPYEVAAQSGRLLITALAADEGERLGRAFATIDPWATYGYPPATLGKFLAATEPGAPRFALSSSGGIVGAAVIRTGWLRGPYLQFLAILPSAQGRGLGAAFLGWMEHEARVAEERNLWVAAAQINAGAIRLYERHGFSRVADLDDLACDGRTEILFRKRLG